MYTFLYKFDGTSHISQNGIIERCYGLGHILHEVLDTVVVAIDLGHASRRVPVRVLLVDRHAGHHQRSERVQLAHLGGAVCRGPAALHARTAHRPVLQQHPDTVNLSCKSRIKV